MKDEALKLALEYLEESDNYLGSLDHSKPIAAIKQALAAPVQPIGYVKLIDTPFGKKLKPVLTIAVPVGSKLYTTPPAVQRQWVDLTDEERDDLLDNYITAEGRARAIEAKLKEKNT